MKVKEIQVDNKKYKVIFTKRFLFRNKIEIIDNYGEIIFTKKCRNCDFFISDLFIENIIKTL